MNSKTLKPINVFVRFAPVMESITGRGEMKVVMSDGAPFVFLMHSIFTSYPELPRRYPPGKLAFTLNDRRPTENDFLHEGDKVAFFV